MHRLRLLIAAASVAGLALVAIEPALARRVVIDENEFGVTLEVWGDAFDGDAAQLPFAIDYGAGLQSAVSITVPDVFYSPPETVQVGINFDVPGDLLFANLTVPPDVVNGTMPVVFLSNEQEATQPLGPPLATVSDFEFGLGEAYTFVPGLPTEETGSLGFYVPYGGTAEFQFFDLSSTGTLGDFGLLLTCELNCSEIGFSLAGLTFSSLGFDPASAPPQLASFEISGDSSIFNFVFRNASGVPEPSSWAMMLLGFGLAGFALRRNRPHPAPLAA